MQTIPGHRIDPKALPYWRWTGVLYSVFICLIPLVYHLTMHLWELPAWIFPVLLLLSVVVAVLYIAVIPKVRWNTWRYNVSEQQIDLHFGVFIKHLIRDADNLKISRGLFEKKQLTIPVNRIQAIKLVEGILRQPFKMVSVKVVSISNAGEKGEGNVLMPVIPSHKVMDFLAEVVPEFYNHFEIEMLPTRSKPRYILINLLPAGLLVAVIFFLLSYAYPALLLLPLAVWLGYLQYRDAGYSLQENMLMIKSRTLGKVTTIVPRRKIQSLSVSRTYFQSKRNLNTLRISIASGMVPAKVKLVGMDDEKSSLISQWFSH